MSCRSCHVQHCLVQVRKRDFVVFDYVQNFSGQLIVRVYYRGA